MVVVTAVDIGIINLAVVSVQEDEGEITKVLHCSVNDITKMRCKDDKCFFNKNDKSSSHRIMHFLKSKGYEIFDNSDYIVIERQPLVGLTGVEQSLFLMLKQRYKKNKFIELISANALHAFYGMSDVREVRKIESVNIATMYLNGFRDFDRAVKKDDMADAFLYCKFFIEKFLPDIRLNRVRNKFLKFMFFD